MPSRAPRGLNWSFTLANYDDADRRRLGELYEEGSCNYLVYQREFSESQLHHLQGYLELESSVSCRTLKRTIGIRTIHLEIARNPDAARTYCTKESTRLDGTEPVSFGDYKVRKPGNES